MCMLSACVPCSGAVQAGLIGYGLFMFATRVEGQVYTSSLPDGYTVSALLSQHVRLPPLTR